MLRRSLRGAAIVECELEYGAIGELAGLLAVRLLPGRLTCRYRRRSVLAALRRAISASSTSASQRPGVEIDADFIPGVKPRKAAARRAFGRGVEDRGTVGRSRLTSVAECREAHDSPFEKCIGGLHVDDFG